MPAEAGGHETELPLKFRRLIRRVMNIDGVREVIGPRVPGLSFHVKVNRWFDANISLNLGLISCWCPF